MADEAMARLTFRSGVLTAADLAAQAGVAPDEVWNKGERVSEAGDRVHAYSGISYLSGLPWDSSPEDHLGSLLNRLAPHAAQLARLGDLVESEGGPGRRYTLTVQLHTDDINADAEVSRTHLPTLATLRPWFALHFWSTSRQSDDG